MNHPLAKLCDQFLTERRYLKNVTPATILWYQIAFKCYRATVTDDDPPLPTKGTLQRFIVRLRERGVRPVTCNTYVTALNAFCLWLHQEGHAAERFKAGKLRTEQR